MNRRAFLGTLGVFSILPGAGRVWRAVRNPEPVFSFVCLGYPIEITGALPTGAYFVEKLAKGGYLWHWRDLTPVESEGYARQTLLGSGYVLPLS